MVNINKEQSKKLWWVDWPYSEINIVIQDRILDNYISSSRVEVTCSINPLTYEIISQNLDKFIENPEIENIIKTSADWWQKHWYVSTPFRCPVEHPLAMKEAQRMKKVTTLAVILMHNFVIKLLGIEVWNKNNKNH